MLSERVIEELLRDTPMREHLVKAAWPSLSVESRLQVIQIVNDLGHNYVPFWLASLAMEDDAPIVRYWAAKSAHLKEPIVDGATGAMRDLQLMLAPTPEEALLYDKVNSDSCDLVSLCVAQRIGPTYETLTNEPQFRRLALLRSHSLASSGAFFAWLSQAIDEGVPDPELAACATEFLGLPTVSSDFTRSSDDFTDGFEAYSAGKSIRAGWDVVKRAGPALQGVLAHQLPIKLGLTAISIDEQASMPETALRTLLWRAEREESFDELAQLIRSHPERFSELIVKTAANLDQAQSFDSETIADRQARSALNQTRSVLDTVLRLKNKIADLASRLESGKQAEPRRRGGFFGR